MASDRRTIQPSHKTGTVTREAAREAVSAVKSSRESKTDQDSAASKPSSGSKRK